MNEAIITTTMSEEMSQEKIGKKIINETVPVVMQPQADAETVGWLAISIIKNALPKRIKVRIGYERARFYRLDKDGNQIGSYLLDISA